MVYYQRTLSISRPMAAKARNEIDTSTYTGRFAERLRMLREKAGLSVEEFSQKSGIPVRSIYNWESGLNNPLIEKFPEIAKTLGVEPRYLLPKK